MPLTIGDSTLTVIDLTKNKIKSLKEVVRPCIVQKAPLANKHNSKHDCNELCSISNIEKVEYPTERKHKISLAMLSSLYEIVNDDPSHNTIDRKQGVFSA